MNVGKFLYVLIISAVSFLSMSTQADENLRKMMEGMLKQHRGLVDNFFKQGFDSQLSTSRQDIKIKSTIEKQNSKTYEKIEITAQDGNARFDIKVTDHVTINANLTKKTQGSQSVSSLTKMFPIPHKGVYKPSMTISSKDKVELYFEVPADHKVYQSAFTNMPDMNGRSLDSFMNIDISKDIDRIKDQLLRSFRDDEFPSQQSEEQRRIIKPKRKALFPQKKT